MTVGTRTTISMELNSLTLGVTVRLPQAILSRLGILEK